jgi:DNA-binding response OmpR family regulator
MAADPDSPTLLATLPTEYEAFMVRDYLIERGIKAHIAGSGSSALGIFANSRVDLQVVVRQSDYAQAKELLERVRENGSSPADSSD